MITRVWEICFPGTHPGAMTRNAAMTHALRMAGVAASGHGFRSSFKDSARQYDVDELLSEFTLAYVEGTATVAAYARDNLLEKRRPVTQWWAEFIAGLGWIGSLHDRQTEAFLHVGDFYRPTAESC